MKQKIKKTSPIKDWPSLFKLLYVSSLPMGHKLHLKPDVNIEFFPTSFLPPGSLVEPSVASPEQKTFRDLVVFSLFKLLFGIGSHTCITHQISPYEFLKYKNSS